jgi:hypothetical protein
MPGRCGALEMELEGVLARVPPPIGRQMAVDEQLAAADLELVPLGQAAGAAVLARR